MTLKPKMYEVYAAVDVLDRATDEQFSRAYGFGITPIGDRRSARSRALNAYHNTKVQKAQRKPRPSGEGWDPEHQIIITLSKKGTK